MRVHRIAIRGDGRAPDLGSADRFGDSILDLGTGRGSSVLEVVAAFAAASGREVPYEVRDRRPGDIAASYADPAKAAAELGWTAERTLAQMCEDAWRWQSANPSGYGV